MRALSTLATATAFASQVLAFPHLHKHLFADKVERPTIVEASFDQLIDHNNPDLGTFPQRYWYNDEWWKGEGSPVATYIWLSELDDLANGWRRSSSLLPARSPRSGIPVI